MRIKVLMTRPCLILSLGLWLVCLSRSAEPQPNLAASKVAYEHKDYPAAFKQLTPLAEQGIAEAQVLLGIMNLKGQGTTRDVQQALKWFRAAADRGNAEGQFYVGSMNLMGAGIDHNTPEGMKWLRLSAHNGSSDAQVLLGFVYLQGADGIPSDLVQADVWFQLAAQGGDPLAPKQVVALEKRMTAAQIDAVHELVTKSRSLE